MTPRRAMTDGGSASIWVLTVSALVLLIALAVQQRSLAVLLRHRAETAADLAALAAAGHIGVDGSGCAAAARVASADGTRLLACAVRLDPTGRSGDVAVRVGVSARFAVVGAGSVTATARAARPP